jgi:hypothetical protein
MNPFESLEQYYPEIIQKMGKRFSSHEFILELAHQHQQLYVQALAQYADNKAPFQVAHSLLAKALTKFDKLVYYIGQEPSVNIFQHTSDASVWGKR